MIAAPEGHTWFGIQIVTLIERGKSEEIMAAIEEILHPGHAVSTEPDCPIELEATTGHQDLEKVMKWMGV